MLTIQHAALAADLDMARARMDSGCSEADMNEEWQDLLPEQQGMFLSIAIKHKESPDEKHI